MNPRLSSFVRRVFPPRRRRAAHAPVAGLLLAALGLIAAAPRPLLSQDDEPRPRTVAVSGEGSFQAAPDRARIRLGVVTEARSAREAARRNAERMARVVEALRGAAIPEKQILTVQLAIEPVYDYAQPEGRPSLRGFQARNLVEVTTTDLARVSEVLDAAIGVGGNTVEGVSFELQDLGAAQAQAMTRAVADARRKAEALAGAARVRLGDVREISATYGGGPVPYMPARTAVMEARGGDAATPVSPGELTVTATVQVTYALE